jgi:hypothetical protein
MKYIFLLHDSHPIFLRRNGHPHEQVLMLEFVEKGGFATIASFITG